METDFLKHQNFSKLMGEGSDVDESDDDDDDMLDNMTVNQNMHDSGIADQPIKLDTSLMSESMIKLVRTIEERIDEGKLGPQTKVKNRMPFPSVQETGEPPVIHCSDFDGDPSVIEGSKYELINDIEQGLNYLYDKGDAGIVSDEHTDDMLAENHNVCDQIQLNKNCNDVFRLDSLMYNNEPSRLESKIVKYQSYDSSKLLELKTKSKSSGLGSDIKKRLGEKVKEVAIKLFQCRECKKKFNKNTELHQHLIAYAHKRKLEQTTEEEEEEKRSRKSREVSLSYDRPAKLRKFSSEKRDLSPEKKVICQHCHEKFFSLENLLYHLRAEHKDRKNHIKESGHRTTYKHSKEKRDSSSQEKTEKEIESGSESNDDVSHETFACSLCRKKFINSYELDNHLRLSHRNTFISNRHKFNCNLCRDTFLTKYDLIQHKEEKHYDGKTTKAFKVGESPKKYVCKFCHVTFMKFQSLKYHVNLAHKLW